MMTGKDLENARKSLNLSQEGLAEILGASRHAIIRWEKDGPKYPGMTKLALEALEQRRTYMNTWDIKIEDGDFATNSSLHHMVLVDVPGKRLASYSALGNSMPSNAWHKLEASVKVPQGALAQDVKALFTAECLQQIEEAWIGEEFNGSNMVGRWNHDLLDPVLDTLRERMFEVRQAMDDERFMEWLFEDDLEQIKWIAEHGIDYSLQDIQDDNDVLYDGSEDDFHNAVRRHALKWCEQHEDEDDSDLMALIHAVRAQIG